MGSTLIIVLGVLLLATFGALIFVLFGPANRKKEIEIQQQIEKKKLDLERLEASISRRREESELESKEILLKAREESQRIAESGRREVEAERRELQRFGDRLEREQDDLLEEKRKISEREKALEEGLVALEKQKQEVNEKNKLITEELERIGGLTKKQAKDEIFRKIEEDEKSTIAARLIMLQDEFRDQEKELSHELLGNVMQRYVSTFIAERTTSSIPLPNDDMKGRIIGREGRNIRAIEEATGVDILVDDTPGSVVISCFEPIRREIGKVALEKLIKDGRIQPAKIETAVKEAKSQVGKMIKKKGEEAIVQVGLTRVEPKLTKLLGRLYYRTSYGQNVLEHSIETAEIAEMLAQELGADPFLAKKAALFHDIGKSVDREIDGTHVEIGVKLGKKFKLEQVVIDAIARHHEDEKPETLIDIITIVADTISSSKPGARRDTLENYLKRLESLENIANSRDGVRKTYAIQAGREIRVFVMPDKIDDAGAVILAADIAKEIESTLSYPGQIKVNVIRETRSVEYAR